MRRTDKPWLITANSPRQGPAINWTPSLIAQKVITEPSPPLQVVFRIISQRNYGQ
jgi:hypothetical protein